MKKATLMESRSTKYQKVIVNRFNSLQIKNLKIFLIVLHANLEKGVQDLMMAIMEKNL